MGTNASSGKRNSRDPESAQTEGGRMGAYRCYFLDRNNQIRSTEEIEAEGLVEAIDRSLTMLKLRPHHHAIELWQGAKMVYPLHAARP
jgi:hypothetical protein